MMLARLNLDRLIFEGRTFECFNCDKGSAVMDQQRDKEQLERKLEQCRRLMEGASDPTTTVRLVKLIKDLEHGLREAAE